MTRPFTARLPSGKAFPVENGASFVDAAAHVGIGLPYSCKMGRCSTCKCQVLSGETRALHEELGLSDDERAAGFVLACVRTPVSDVALDVDDLDGVQLPPARTVPCRIASIEAMADDVLKLTLRLPPAVAFHWLAGQYVDVIGPGGVRRSYSLANAAAVGAPLEIHVRKVTGGVMSRYWFEQAKPNDLLRLHGPLGTFFLRQPAGRDLVFLATGTGIAPIIAMLQSLHGLPEDQRPRSLHVVWGGRHLHDIYVKLPHLDFPFTFTPVLSRAAPGWAGAKGYVQNALLEAVPELDQATVYACGSAAMIRSAKSALVKTGLPEHQFFSDAFVCSSTGELTS